MLFLMLACEPAPAPAPVVEEPTVQTRPAVGPRYSQEQLADSEQRATLQGILVCPDSTGPWTLALYADHPEYRGPSPSKLPWMQPEAQVELQGIGPFELLVPQGAARLLLAHQDQGKVQAFADPGASLMDIHGSIEELVLDCRHTPTWPRGVAPVAEVGKAEKVAEATPDRSVDWLYTTKSGHDQDRMEREAYEERRADFEHRFRGDPNVGDIAGSLAIMPEEMAAEAADAMEAR